MAPKDRDMERGNLDTAGSFNKLRDEISPDARDRVSQRVRDTLLEMTLQELRQNASDKTQVELAEFLELTRGAIAQIDGRQDVLLSKLAKYIHALGGDLELVARFPDADVRITQFEQEDDGKAAAGA
jgi:DNA-binding XRE family transcriptional regulator